MAYSMVLVLMVFLAAFIAAMAGIGLAVYFILRRKTRLAAKAAKEIDAEQAEEITATWHVLNP